MIMTIRELRHRRGYSISDVAELLQISPEIYAYAELFPNDVPENNLEFLCSTLDADEIDLALFPLCSKNDYKRIAELIIPEL